MPIGYRAILVAVVVGMAPTVQAGEPELHTGGTPSSIVARIYKDYAWEAIFNNPPKDWRSFNDQSPSALRRHFTPGLATRLIADRRCEMRTKGICQLDFSIIYASQDPQVTDLKIQNAGPRTVDVRFLDSSGQNETHLRYTLKRTPAGWRIDDIQYFQPRGTLRELLAQK